MAAAWLDGDSQKSFKLKDASCLCEKDNTLTCRSTIHKQSTGGQAHLFEINVDDSDLSFGEKPSVSVECYPLSHSAPLLPIYQHIFELSLNLTVIESLTVNSCHIGSTYTKLAQAMGIQSVGGLKLVIEGIRTTLKKDSFKEMSKVYPDFIDLDVHGNGITSISEGVFDDAFNLQYISVHSTNISVLPERLFVKLPRLSQVTIFDNRRLTMLPETMFGKVNSVVKLALTQHGLVKHLPVGIFTNLQHLEHLNIGTNNFATIPGNLLHQSCNNLTTLSMVEDFFQCPKHSNGCHRVLPSDLLKTCRKLQKFQYSFMLQNSNNTLQIPADFFDNQNPFLLNEIQLEHTNLSKQQLTDVFFDPKTGDVNFKNMTKLTVRGNNIHWKDIYCNQEHDCDIIKKIWLLKNHTKYIFRIDFKQGTIKNHVIHAQWLIVAGIRFKMFIQKCLGLPSVLLFMYNLITKQLQKTPCYQPKKHG